MRKIELFIYRRINLKQQQFTNEPSSLTWCLQLHRTSVFSLAACIFWSSSTSLSIKNLLLSFVLSPSDHHPGNPRQTKKALRSPSEKGPRYRMKVERRCKFSDHSASSGRGRSMVHHNGGQRGWVASFPSFFTWHRVISMRHRRWTGSEAATLAQHAISERHRRTEVVDYLKQAAHRRRN